MCVTISSLCKLTMIVDKQATVQLTAATKTCLSIISCFTIHELSVLHAWECDAITRNVVKRLANQNCVNSLFDMIGQSDVLSFYGTEKNTCLGHRGPSGTKKTSFNLSRSTESFVVFCQISCHNLRGLSMLCNQSFPVVKASSGPRELGRFHDWN